MSRFPIIVVEGPDGVGKTTLCDKLCETLDAKYIHLTYRFKDKMDLYHGAALSYCLKVAETRPVVLDRWWMSETVYASAYRGGTRWPLLHRHLERVALREGVSYVMCLPQDRERYLEHFNVLKGKREEMYDSGMDRVYDGFSRIHKRLQIEGRPAVYLYDMFEQGHDMKAVVQGIVETSEDERALLPSIHDVDDVSGSLVRGKFLVVEDHGAYFEDAPPLVYPTRANLRFSAALEVLGVPESDLAYAKTSVSSGREAVETLSRHMKVVALGRRAADRLGEFEVPVYRTVGHPVNWCSHTQFDHLNLMKVFDNA